MANLIYNSFKTELKKGVIDLETDDIKMMLVTSAYTPLASHSKRSDITNEVVGDGYTAGGQSLTGKTVGLVGNKSVFDADSVVWDPASITAGACVLYKSRGGAATADELIVYLPFAGDATSVAAPFTVNPHVDGIIDLDQVAE